MGQLTNGSALASALRSKASEVREVYSESTVDNEALRDAASLLRVLANVAEGMPLLKALGAPGDWGYDTAIGRGVLELHRTHGVKEVDATELTRLADAFERSADWLDKGVLTGSRRTHPLVGTADYRKVAEVLRRTHGVAVPDAPQVEPEPQLVGYDECRCILTQYCDGTCRPVFALPAVLERARTLYANSPGAYRGTQPLPWDRAPMPTKMEFIGRAKVDVGRAAIGVKASHGGEHEAG